MIIEWLYTTADRESAVDGKGFVHDRLPWCIVTRWSFFVCRHKPCFSQTEMLRRWGLFVQIIEE